MSTDVEYMREYRKNVGIRDEAYRRTLSQVRNELKEIDRELQRQNLGTARDMVDTLRESIDDEFGEPMRLRNNIDERIAALEARKA